LLAAGHRAGELGAPLGEAREDRINLGNTVARDGLRTLLIGAEPQVFLDGEFRENLAAFWDAGDAGGDNLVGRQRGDVVALERDAAGARRRQAKDRAEQRLIAGAV
jgi:hypothetical protein